MPGHERQAVARARLAARRTSSTDAELIDETLASVAKAVEERGSLDDAEAEKVAVEEVRRMRADKRARDWLASRR